MSRTKNVYRRSKRVDSGLRAMSMIVRTLRESVGEVDDPEEEEAIKAAMMWIGGLR